MKQSPSELHTKQRLSRWWLSAGIVALLLCIGELSYWIVVERNFKRGRGSVTSVVRVQKIQQITIDGLPKKNLIGDGSRIYFNERSDTEWQVMEMSNEHKNPEALSIAVRNPKLLDVSAQSELLVSSGAGLQDAPQSLSPKIAALWVVAPPAAPRRLGTCAAFAAAWAPNGKIVFSQAKDLYIAERDGSNPNKLLTALGPILAIKFSPDGTIMRLTIGLIHFRYMLWQARADGSDMHPILPLPGVQRPTQVCCGSWTRDGQYFFYEDLGEIWRLQEKGNGQFGSPVHLDSGDQSLHDPVPIAGNEVIAIGERAQSPGKPPVADIYRLDLQ